MNASKNWLVEPTVKGIPAFFCAIGAVAVPTAIRAAVDGAVMGCQTIPYVPFVVLASIFLGWRYAIVIALASATFADILFMGPHHQHAFMGSTCDVFGVGGLLISSGFIIGFVEAARSHLRDLIKEHKGEVVFSLKDGQAWATWYGHSSAVHLGTQDKVSEMMRDFLNQTALAERWKTWPPRSAQSWEPHATRSETGIG